MKVLKFEGYSDDVFGEYNLTNTEIDNCAQNTPIQCIVKSRLTGEALVVIGHYHLHPLNEGCWTIGISLLRENEKVPTWPTRFIMGDCKYSPMLEIEVPDDVQLTWYTDGKLVE